MTRAEELAEKVRDYMVAIGHASPPDVVEAYAALSELVADAEALAEALAVAVDLAIWMSGASAFGPEGEAGEVWPKKREGLYAAMETLARYRGERR